MERYRLRTKTEAVDLALRHLAGQPMTRDEALAMLGAHAIDEVVADAAPAGGSHSLPTPPPGRSTTGQPGARSTDG